MHGHLNGKAETAVPASGDARARRAGEAGARASRSSGSFRFARPCMANSRSGNHAPMVAQWCVSKPVGGPAVETTSVVLGVRIGGVPPGNAEPIDGRPLKSIGAP